MTIGEHRTPMAVHTTVETLDHRRNFVEKLSWERTHTVMSDSLKALLGNGKARVSVSLSEKISGPVGYSSVSTNVSVTFSCNQDEDTVNAASAAAFEQAVAVTDEIFPKAMQLLEAHLQRYVQD